MSILSKFVNGKDTPVLPFPNFKWKWATVQCTEGIDDPLVLLGVLFRMRKLEGKFKYSSEEFGEELKSLSKDLEGTGVNLQQRTGARNLIRNSGQYWRALNLIPKESTRGIITLTNFGRKVADHIISQTEFSAITIVTFKLPNPGVYTKEECKQWENAGLEIYPLKLILSILQALFKNHPESGYIKTDELTKIIIPLSATPNRPIESYMDYILAFREGKLMVSQWPSCTPRSNDFRIAREFLLFLSNYGYINKIGSDNRHNEKYKYNPDLDAEITEIISTDSSVLPSDLVSDTERKIVNSQTHKSQHRPNQAKFRKAVLEAYNRCIITNVDMPEVLEAAHIVPFKYHGEDTAANGFPMRMDIHYLFDAGQLRIKEDGEVFVTDRVRMSYGSFPHRIILPDYVNKDFIRWRWENYNGM